MNPSAMSPRLLGPMGRLLAVVVDITGPAGVRERLLRAGDGELPDDQVDALGAELDLLAGLLAGR